MAPEVRKDILIRQKYADVVGELFPDEMADAIFLVQVDQRAKKLLKSMFFSHVRLESLGCISRVEADPEKDKAGVRVTSFILCPAKPTDCTMYPKRHARGSG